MKLSKNTITILNNFKDINQSIIFKPGNEIRITSNLGHLMGKATVEETFPKEVGIYDLSSFLSSISLLGEPELEFGDKSVEIKSKNSTLVYHYTEKSLIKDSDKNFTISPKDADLVFEMTKESFANITKASGLLGIDSVKVHVKDGDIIMSAVDGDNDKKDTFSVVVGQTDTEFEGYGLIKTEHMKYMSATYEVRIGKLKNGSKSIPVIELVNADNNLTYFGTLDPSSTY